MLAGFDIDLHATDNYFDLKEIAESFLVCGGHVINKDCYNTFCLISHYQYETFHDSSYRLGTPLDNFCVFLAYLGRVALERVAKHYDLKSFKQAIERYVYEADVKNW